MENYSENNFVDSSWQSEKSMIKVVGVGGGGCNAVNYMYKQKIKGCQFVVCNTDSQALTKSEVPTKVQLGEGLGAGTDPTKGRNAALESQDIIAKTIVDDDTKMLFITAGMGGGTGTGASPVIAKMAKDKGILTVGVVTIPFSNEGEDFRAKAQDGLYELQRNVDSLLVINNDKLYEYFGEQLIHEAFPKADEVLATAVRGIIEIITEPGYINVDFEDVKTMMKNSGMALMGCGTGTGKNRLEDAVKGALESPLLSNHDLSTAKNLLINITVGANDSGANMSELGRLEGMIQSYTGHAKKSKRGIIYNYDPDFGDRINITAIATGFKMDLTDLSGSNLGKLIIIDKDFTYSPKAEQTTEGEGGSIVLPDPGIHITTVSLNSLENIPKFDFSKKKKPVLVLSPNQNRSELEQYPAIYRSRFRKSETELN